MQLTVDGRNPIPNHLAYINLRQQRDKRAINWCRIHSINSMFLFVLLNMVEFPRGKSCFCKKQIETAPTLGGPFFEWLVQPPCFLGQIRKVDDVLLVSSNGGMISKQNIYPPPSRKDRSAQTTSIRT